MAADVLIVGAGSAGCVLAERLSADPDCRVLVVEAGPGLSDPGVAAQISDGLRLPIGDASSVVRRYATTLTEDPLRPAVLMRGAVVGGSGAVNGGYFCRGLPADFAAWQMPGWSWDDVLPHFRAIETDRDHGGPLHGDAGPMLIRRVTDLEQGAVAFVEAARALGYPWIEDLNGVSPDAPPRPGVGAVPLNIDRGTRVGPGGAFLAPAAHRPNLRVLDRTAVHRIRISGGRATGVDCVGPDGARTLTADRIVLSAGAIGSAHLLLLSGVGPAADLRALDVPVHADLPVGARCVDHPEWVLPVDWPAAPGRPPLEAVLVTDGLEIRPYTTGFGAMTGGPEHPEDRPHLGVTLTRPRARGRIRLRSADPGVAPRIEHRYDTEPDDVAALTAGADLAHDLAGTGYAARQAHWSTSQHLCGSAPLGEVLDERCRVLGVGGLWVVDGSIMPDITSRGPHATIVMIGSRAAEFVSA
ncbi:mycofactocin dehydrogenase MftG [Mycolicibacterium grossiae]|uniref:Glucose-methanol-choline oxidoreductase n=1 Tax=Mycolicibacterium grossiae TaxID=1552759 RepID=A0A1E8Q8P6_9MYCO|nr:mycofactocin system GMC family oxidoreductase MftG [Mycolicibacterium grossiae]OFJ54329.1 glucose-methanol-choline oxidoreductase [Mycolicibacterium grossiae]QEM45292.1 mycofactocin system GMC family oxidoreductase MftG [Mycolicibacterium grossiae]